MSAPLLISVPNASEGRDDATIRALAAAFADDSGRAGEVRLLDVHTDADHHRSVFTAAGPAAALIDAVMGAARVAVERIDVVGAADSEPGQHPHVGALDVAPVVYLDHARRGAACAHALVLADRIGQELQVPVFLYGPLESGERTLPYVRAHAFKGLAPDFGPSRPDPRSGAVVVGARDVLVAWNIWLTGVDLERARLLAQLIRRPGVRALGLQVGDHVQVSCNLVDLALATPSEVYDQVNSHLAEGATIERAELVGLIPRSLLEAEDPVRWEQLGLSEDSTIESRLGR